MKTDTKEKIIKYIRVHQRVRVDDLVKEFRLSHVAIHKQLKQLVEKGKISKQGKPPLVFYFINSSFQVSPLVIDEREKNKIDQNYLYVSPVGKITEGFLGFTQWLKETKQDQYVTQLASEYLKTREEANRYFTSYGWIDATKKIYDTFSKVYLYKVFYGDFYALPKFGKTKLGQLVLYAKQSQSRELVKRIADFVKPLIDKIIKKYTTTAVVFIPPTVPRKIQFMKELQKYLQISLPEIIFVKAYPGEIPVPQKSLPKLEQRITNARETIIPKNTDICFQNILLIDDAVGSGATFNETATKLKKLGMAKGKIIAFAVVGSMKGFEVISEI